VAKLADGLFRGRQLLLLVEPKESGSFSLCLISFSLAFIFAVFIASPSLVLRQMGGGGVCIYKYIGMLLWRNWQGLGRQCTRALEMKLILISACASGRRKAFGSLVQYVTFLLEPKELSL
jgi:hypothetical protein